MSSLVELNFVAPSSCRLRFLVVPECSPASVDLGLIT
jgi:hypothetical protein